MDIYIRVSQLGERDEEESTDVYEAQCREWADRHHVVIERVAGDTNVSGSTAVAERDLEQLIQRVQSGDSEGIITPYLDRFGRDLIEGALALKRISEAGGKLIAVKDGFDSTAEGSQLVFNLRMAIAEDFLRRNKANRLSSQERAAGRGVYLSGKAPFGYLRDDDGRLIVVEIEAAVVKELFARRAAGESYASLRKWINGRLKKDGVKRLRKDGTEMGPISKSGIRAIVKNRAYLGENVVQTKVKGEPRIVKGSHPPILTEQEWEEAQGTQPFVPRTGLALKAQLRGLVHCSGCHKRVKVLGYSKPGDEERTANYACTSEGCTQRVSMKAEWLDDYVSLKRMEAAIAGEPHIVAVIEGDTRYEDAMAAVRQAQADLEEYRDSVELQRALGPVDFAKGIETRKDSVKVSRQRMADVKPVSVSLPRSQTSPTTREQVEAMIEADANVRFIDRVVLKPSLGPDGKRLPPSERADIYWAGADTPA